MLARLTRLGISCDATPSQILSARAHFEQHNYLRLPGFLEPRLLRVVQRHLSNSFFEKKYDKVGLELRLPKDPVPTVFRILMNDPKFFRLIRGVTGCGPIGCFAGRLYRLVARQGHAFVWHDDMVDDRKVAISINLSDAPYRGGTLEIRERSSAVHDSVPNLGFGDAVIFRVDESVEHRVTPVVGEVPKTAYSGWFCTRPRYTSVHSKIVAQSESAIAARAIRKLRRLALPSPHDVVKIPSAVVCQTTGRKTFVANISTAMCYGLDEIGGRVWELMAEGHEMRSISATIANEYAAPRRNVERDILELAHKLAQRDLVKVVRT
jgi:hypothetical protein